MLSLGLSAHGGNSHTTEGSNLVRMRSSALGSSAPSLSASMVSTSTLCFCQLRRGHYGSLVSENCRGMFVKGTLWNKVSVIGKTENEHEFEN